jgi:hypothetical protein
MNGKITANLEINQRLYQQVQIKLINRMDGME